MNFIIFTDIDGTLLDHEDYKYGNLKNYLQKIKKKVSIIFNSSKTFEEIVNINKKLELNYPFIVENGACIFFPPGYLGSKEINKNFFKYKSYIGYKLTNYDSKKIITKFAEFKNKYNFCFYSELSDKRISEITNLRIADAKQSKKRLFTNPIFWKDTKDNILKFKLEMTKFNHKFNILEGGRFLHIADNYNKAIALRKFMNIIKTNLKGKFTTVSLGDSENDVCMLESTNYSCIVKRKKNKISLKKQDNIYFSKAKAPDGWSESLDFVFRMEKNYF